MAEADTTESKVIQYTADFQAAERASQAFVAATQRDQKRLEQLTKRHNKKLWMSTADYQRRAHASYRQEKNANDGMMEAKRQIDMLVGKITKAYQDQAHAVATGQTRRVGEIAEEIDLLQQTITEYEGIAAAALEARQSIKDNQDYDFKFEVTDPDLKAAGEGLSEAFAGFAQKDILSVGSALGKSFSKTLSKTLRVISTTAGKNEGKGGAMAGILKSIGPAMASIGRFLPILSMLGSGLMSIVKLLLDMEAEAKEFQKSLLSTTSTIGFMTRAGDNANVAYEDLGATLRGIRNAAWDIGNVRWGLNREDYAATMNELTSAGMQLEKFQEEAGQAYAAANKISESAVLRSSQKISESVQVMTTRVVTFAKAYSSSMGVSLQEVTGLMGELKGQMGLPLAVIETSFGKMAAQAEESGIAANQFFNIIRGMSADMSLFNNRMDAAGKILSKLTKVMDPRRASQFLQTIQSYFKGQSLMDRVRSVAITGTAGTKKRLQEDIDVKVSGLAADLEKSGINREDLKDAVAKGGKVFVKFLMDNDKKLSGAQREALQDAMTQQEKVRRGDMVSLASGLKDIGILGTYEQKQAESLRLFGARIENLSSTQLLAADQAIGLNDDLIDQFRKFQLAIDLNREEIATRIERGTMKDADVKLLEELKITLKKGASEEERAAAAQALRARKAEDIFKHMSMTDQQAINKMTKQEDFAQKTANFQVSILDKIKALFDWITNQIYDALLGMWELLSEIGPNNQKMLDQISLARAARTSSSDVVKGAIQRSSEDPGQLKQELLWKSGSFGDKLIKTMGNMKGTMDQASKKYDDAIKEMTAQRAEQVKKRDEAKTPASKKAASDVIAALDANIKQQQEERAKVRSQLSKARSDSYELADRTARESGKLTEVLKKIASWNQSAESAIAKKLLERGPKDTRAGRMEYESIISSFSAATQDAFRAAMVTETVASQDDSSVVISMVEKLSSMWAPAGLDKDPLAVQKEALASVGQAGANQAMEAVAQEGVYNRQSLAVHDAHAEPLLQTIAASVSRSDVSEVYLAEIAQSLGGSTESGKTPEMKATEKLFSVSEEQADLQMAQKASLTDIYNVLKVRGIRLNNSQLTSDIKRVYQEATLDSMETALFEYAIMTGEKSVRNALAAAAASGSQATGAALMKQSVEQVRASARSIVAENRAERERAVTAPVPLPVSAPTQAPTGHPPAQPVASMMRPPVPVMTIDLTAAAKKLVTVANQHDFLRQVEEYIRTLK